MLETSAFESLYGGQFTLSTQLMKPNYKDILDPRLLWDWIKFKIRSNSIIFSKQIASIRRKREEELNKRYREAVLMFQTNPCDNMRLALEKCKQDFEALYEEKVEGIILRARAR